MLEAARSQIAGTISQAEVRDAAAERPQLPRSGAAGARRVADQHRAARSCSPKRRRSPAQGLSVGSQRNFSNNFIVDGLSANDDAAGLSGIPYGVDAVDQFQVVTSGGQAELGRALGGYINVVTQERHERAARRPLRLLPRRQLQRAECAVGHEAADVAAAVRRQPRAARCVRNRTFYFANVEQRRLDQTGLTTISAANVSHDQRAAGRGRLSRRRRSRPASIRIRSTRRTSSGRSIIQFSGRDQFSVRYSLYDVTSSNCARRRRDSTRRPPRPALDNRDQTIAVSNTLTLSPRTVNETRGAVRAQRSAGAADRSDRPGGQHRRRRDVRHAVRQSDSGG